jgi:signal transduction histidine kinase
MSSQGGRGHSIRSSQWLIAAVCIPLVLMLWASYRAAAEWQRAATRVAAGRAETAAALLETALSRDMRAVQTTVLPHVGPRDAVWPPDIVLTDTIASAFARYPYPEVFFTWTAHVSNPVTFYARSERYPMWLPREDEADLYPIIVGRESTIGDRILERVSRSAADGQRYALFNMEVNASIYQVVAALDYHDRYRERLRTVFGFMVDMTWLRTHYFNELTTQVAGISEVQGMTLSILDEHGRTVVGSPPQSGGIVARRPVHMLFFDPRLVAVQRPADLTDVVWTVEAFVLADPMLRAANIGARQTLAIGGAGAVVLALGVVLVVRAARTRVQLSELRSEFISTVTHELKTPLASIQAIGETFVSDRGITREVSRKYGRLTLHEAKRLRRQIDNLLAYGHIANINEFYSFERIFLGRLIAQTLRDFESQLEYVQFSTEVDIPSRIRDIRADERAMKLVFSNLIDNAIRYSPATRFLRITAREDDGAVVIAVSDRGSGITKEDLPNVTLRFFRGRSTDASGSGLGLAIVERIVTDHGGSLKIESAVDVGTTVTMTLPVAT